MIKHEEPQKTYSAMDVYRAAMQEIEKEMTGWKGKPLNEAEELKMAGLSRILSREVLKEMRKT